MGRRWFGTRSGAFLMACAAFSAIWLLRSGSAFAFCPDPNPPRVCTEFFEASAVFIGTVVSITEKPGEDDFIDGWFYRLNVTKTYRGAVKSTVEVFTANDSGRFTLEKDVTYLLFPVEHNGIQEIYGCGNSAEISAATGTIRQLDKIIENRKAASGGDIGGRVASDPGGNNPVAGIKIVARAEGNTYAGMTAKDGRFHIHVPAGHYIVEGQSSDWRVSGKDISWDRPDDIEIHDGGCADLALHALPSR